MQLKDGEIGQNYVVKNMELPLSLQRRLEALGMTHNTTVMVVNRKGPGVMIIKLRGSRYALGVNITKNIKVTPLTEDLTAALTHGPIYGKIHPPLKD